MRPTSHAPYTDTASPISIPVIDTFTPTPTPPSAETLTSTPTPITEEPLPSPIIEVPSQPVACEAFARSKLQVGMRAVIQRRLNFRSSPGLFNNWLLTNVQGMQVEVIGGPACTIYRNGGSYLWWQTQLPNGLVGGGIRFRRVLLHGAPAIALLTEAPSKIPSLPD